MSAGRLPTFLIIGAMKSGTTTLYRHLTQHPAVYMPEDKEPDFFVAEKAWDNGIDWYAGLFAEAGDATAVGEASTSYTKSLAFPGVAERIRSIVPDVRLLYVVREPVARAVSQYQHNALMSRERRPADIALLDDPGYVDASSYARQLREYTARFPREQIFVLVTERLGADPVGQMRAVYEFLGIDADFLADHERRYNVTAERRAENPLTQAVRRSDLLSRAWQRLPTQVRGRASKVVARPLAAEGHRPSAETLRELRRRLAGDTAEFYDLMGGPVPEWGITPAAP